MTYFIIFALKMACALWLGCITSQNGWGYRDWQTWVTFGAIVILINL